MTGARPSTLVPSVQSRPNRSNTKTNRTEQTESHMFAGVPFCGCKSTGHNGPELASNSVPEAPGGT
eukprot:7370584-Alexandrium_andersonii.AAC.1